MNGKYSTLSILIKRNNMYYIFCFIVRNICMYKQGSFVLFRSALVSPKIVEIEGRCFLLIIRLFVDIFQTCHYVF